MSKIVTDVRIEFRVGIRARLRLLWRCLRGGHFILILPESTVNLTREPNK